MYENVLNALSDMIDDIKKDSAKLAMQKKETIYFIKNSRTWDQLRIAIEMLCVVGKRYMLLRDRMTFAKKTQKEINKRFKKDGV